MKTLLIATLVAAGSLVALVRPASAHQGHTTNVAWEACADAALDAACAFEDGDHALYRGTCRSMSESLVCVRNQPIVPAAERDAEADTGAAPGPHAHDHDHDASSGAHLWLLVFSALALVGLSLGAFVAIVRSPRPATRKAR